MKNKLQLILSIFLTSVSILGLISITIALLETVNFIKVLSDLNKETMFNIILAAFTLITMTIIIYGFNKKLFRTPTSLTISLLGLPFSGKTVYITVLFRELLIRKKLRGFSLYGEETVERVQEDCKILQYSN